MRSIVQKIWSLVKRGQVLVVALAFGIMVYSSYLFVGAIVRGYSKHDGEQSLALMQGKIESDLLAPKTALEVFSETLRRMILRGDNADMVQECINELTSYILFYDNDIPGFSGVFAYIETLPGGPVYISEDPSRDGLDPAESPWFHAAIAAGGRIAQTPPTADDSSGKCVFTYSRCLFDDRGRRIGVIGLDVSLEKIAKYVVAMGNDEGGYGLLLNENLEVIAHPLTSQVGKALYLVDKDMAALMDNTERTNISERRVVDYRNDDVVVFFRRLDCGWHVGVVLPYSRYYQDVNDLLKKLIIMGVVLAAALSALLLYLSKARSQADAKNQQKSNFLATMSHEIRTPMNAILGITEIELQDKTLSQDHRDALGKIRTSGDLLLGIINDILDLSKIEAGKMELVPTKYEVPSLINDVVQLNRLRFENKPIEFKLQVDENIPSVLVGDELRIKQILNNLLSNAFKYTDEGEILFSVAAQYPSGSIAAHVMLVFRVSDTGQGMTVEQVKNLFNEYARFNMEANRSTEGTGLGMSITRNLLRLMNGNIRVESTPGKGTTVVVYLPQRNAGIGVAGMLGREVAENLRQFNLDSTAQLGKPQIAREPMSYGRVLIVDDVESNLYVAKGLMAPYGLSIDTAISGFEAVDKIKTGNVYDIIFMDHMMPRMDGIEATKIIRSLGYRSPIVALTANALAGQAEMFLKNGFDGFISKPIDIRQLNASLNKLIRDKQPREVIEAELRRKEQEDKSTEKLSKQSADPELLEFFAQDAERAIAALEAICLNEYRRTDDMQMYTITVHGMKSALANIGQTELSAFALKLEEAGREKNIELMFNETPVFLEALRALVEQVKPKDDEGGEAEDEEADDVRAYLREKMLAIEAACAVYDKKTAKDAVNELKQKKWSRPTKELLNTITEHLLHSEFDEASTVVKNYIKYNTDET